MKPYKLGYTSGTFDFLHDGHRNIIKKAKELCEKLIVAVSSEDLCYQYKKIIPVQTLKERMEQIRQLPYVDKVVVQETMDKHKAFEKYGFDVMFVGSDWKGTDAWLTIEKSFIGENVEIVYLQHTDGISSSIIRKELYTYNFKYNQMLDGYYVCKYSGDKSNIEIPHKFRNKKIVGIAPRAFAFCNNIKKIVCPDSVVEIGDEAFLGCESLRDITMSDNVKKIGRGAFAYCTNLKRLKLPLKLNTLTSYLLSGCKELINIELPNNIIRVERNCFDNNSSFVEKKHGSCYIGNWCIGTDYKSEATVEIEQGTIGLADGCFLGIKELHKIILPSSVKHIGMYAFDGSGIWNDTKDNSVVYADNWAVGWKGNILNVSELSIKKGTIGIGDMAFAGFLNLQRVEIPPSVKYIGRRAFD